MALESNHAAETGTPVASDSGPGRREREVRSRPIAAYLLLLVIVAIVPVLTFSVLLLDRNNRAQQAVVSTLAETTASSYAQAVDREVTGMLTTLRVLATAPSLISGRFQDFYDRAQVALRGTGANLILLDAQYNQILNTRFPYGVPLGQATDAEAAASALKVRAPVVSEVFFGKAASKWVFNVVLPLDEETGTARVLVMTQDADSLTEALKLNEVTGGWNVALVDGEGIVIASSDEASEIGKPFFIALKGITGLAPRHIDVNVGDVPFEAITQRSLLTGWSVVVWAPRAAMQAPLRRSIRYLVLGGLIAIAFAGGAAWLLAQQIAKPVRRLEQDARRLGAGEVVAAFNSPIAEISTISRTLAEAGASRKAAENEIRFLMREVAHRSKNQLTVVSSIAKQSARSAKSLPAFQDSFLKRIQGLARSTDLLLAGGVAGIEFRALLAAQVEPFRPDDPGRMELDGPEVKLSNQAAQTLGLALHELATNAAKYGAFAYPRGRLVLTWKTAGDKLDFVWREYVPGLRRRVERRGFGSEVIDRMVARSLDAEIERSLNRDGIELRFLIPLAMLRPGPGGPDSEA